MLKQKTISAIIWSVGSKVFSQILQFFIMVVLARLLSPKEYGLMGIVMVLTGFAGIFGDLGTGPALIQRNDLNDGHYSSVYWFNVVCGVVIALMLAVASPMVAKFYHEPLLQQLTQLVSLNFIINSFGVVSNALLLKQLEFKKLAVITVTSMIIGGMVAIVMALSGFGVFSLAWQSVITSISTQILLRCGTAWEPKLYFSVRSCKDLFHFSSNLTGFNIFNYFSRNGDNFLIGKFIGAYDLGIYSRAYGLMLLPLTQVTGSIGQVMLPVFCRFQHDESRMRRIYMQAITYIALLTFPLMLGLFTVADTFILVVYGEKWSQVIPILKVFCIVGMVQSIVATTGWIFLSLGKADIQLRWGLISGSIALVSIITGVAIGTIMAVTVCYAIANLLLLYHNFTIPGKLIGLRFVEIVQTLRRLLLLSVIMAVVVWMCGGLVPTASGNVFKLIVQIVIGISTYGVLVFFYDNSTYRQLVDLMKNRGSVDGYP